MPTRRLSPQESRTIGALLGLHAGDSLGATLEFQSHAHIAKVCPNGPRDIIGGGVFDWPPGHATDDTDMTRAVLLAYRDSIAPRPGRGSHFGPVSGAGPGGSHLTEDYPTLRVARAAGAYFVDWYEGHWPGRKTGAPPKDAGGATRKGIAAFRKNPYAPSGAGKGSAGNGSLMRCLPSALFQPDLARMAADSQAISALTHDDWRCTISCAAYNACAAALVAGATPAYAVAAAEATAAQLETSRPDGGRMKESAPVSGAIRAGRRLHLARAAFQGPHTDFFPDLCSGFVLDTLTLAVAAVLDPRSFEDVLVDVIRMGKDTDTNGAVAGGLLGARDGEDAIPARWKHVLQFGLEFHDTALEILDELGKKKNV